MCGKPQTGEGTGYTVADRAGNKKQSIRSRREHKAGSKKLRSSLDREHKAVSRKLETEQQIRSGKGTEVALGKGVGTTLCPVCQKGWSPPIYEMRPSTASSILNIFSGSYYTKRG